MQGTTITESVTEFKEVPADDPLGGFDLFDLDSLTEKLKLSGGNKAGKADSPEEENSSSEEEEEKSDGGDDESSGDWSKLELEALKRHNELRKKHGAPAMRLSRQVKRRTVHHNLCYMICSKYPQSCLYIHTRMATPS